MSVDANVAHVARSAFPALLRKSFAAHVIFLFPLSLYSLAYEWLRLARPDAGMAALFPDILPVLLMLIIFFLGSLLMMRFYHIARYVKPKSPSLELMREMKLFLSDRRRLANGAPVMLIMAVMAFVFSEIQGSILTLNPRTWDVEFAQLDKWLHFGKHPWEWLQPVLGYAPITFLINVNYNMWFFTMIMLLVWFGFSQNTSQDRTRFILSYMGIWVVGGNIFAVFLSSAGPCYYGRLGLSPDPYQGLMAYLRHVNETIPVWAVSLQDLLWTNHLAGNDMREVSAMPSLHNASALLFALMGFRVSKLWGCVLTVHAVLIYLGSIHLGWHYAIDAYLGWAITLVIWSAAGLAAQWWHGTAAQREFEGLLESEA